MGEMHVMMELGLFAATGVGGESIGRAKDAVVEKCVSPGFQQK